MVKLQTSQVVINGTGDFHNRYVFLSMYLVFSCLSVAGNGLICSIIFRSKRMRSAPKYWLVLIASFALIVQALGPNSLMSAKWITEEFPASCWIWSVAVIYGNYAGVAMVTYPGLLLHLDFLLCLLSSSYMNRKRPTVAVVLLLLTCTLVLGILLPMSVILGDQTSSAEASCNFHMRKSSYQDIMIWFSLFIPVILSIVCCLAICLCRSNRSVQKFIGVNTGIICESMETEVSSVLPPADHLAFLFLEILMYFPFGVANYGDVNCHYDKCPNLFSFLVICSTLSDNAGGLLHLSWYFFIDVRKGFKKMCRLSSPKSGIRRLTSGAADLQVFDTYPYCVMSSEF